MKTFILKMYNTLINLSMIIIILAATVFGSTNNGIFGALLGFIGGFLFVTIFFGTLILFMDMRDSLLAIKKSLEK